MKVLLTASEKLFQGTILGNQSSIEPVKMPIWVHGTPLPMIGEDIEINMGARMS